ncbi:Tyrosyl-DNA phosphodiesterase 2 [Madurella mycetomatis]|uniref:Tyrosyl-DNA phosphodiesterase 2 n=1 Tax=Madurella mycetomatis TaxID=100816 RepID=A0A175VPK8_9PEZI|nr:Tyrosyl-DNA phosphodiesterase 2 [Madurella mycetomatis]
MALFSWVRRYVSNWWQTSALLREPDATAIIQPWHTFDRGEQRWAALALDDFSRAASPVIVSDPGNGRKKASNLTLWTWNVDAFEKCPEARMNGIITAIQERTLPPDVLFFQEVSRAALSFLLAHPWIRDNWYSSEAGDTNWPKQQFSTITLLSKHSFDHGSGNNTSRSRLGLVWRVKYPTRFGRDALCCEVFLGPAGVPVRLVNVHLDSLPIQPNLRPRQLAIVAGILRNTGRGLVAGDFNPVLPADDALVAENRLIDAWAELHPGEDGFTWGIDGQQLFPPARLDKIAMIGLRPREIEVIQPGILPKKERGIIGEGQLGSGEREKNCDEAESISWSDHSGLRCTLSLVDVTPT